MTNEKFYELIGEIDDHMISDSLPAKRVFKKSIFIKLGAIAAAAAITITGAAIYNLENPFETVRITISDKEELNTAPILKWEERTICEQYTEFKTDTAAYESTCGNVPESLIGDHIGASSLYGYDEIENKSYFIIGEVYEIKNVSTDYAVAVKISGTDVYYSYRNWAAKPSNLGEFIDSLALTENLCFNNAYIEYTKPLSHNTVDVYYENIKANKLWELIIESRNAENINDDTPELSEQMIKKAVSFSINVPILGLNDISMSLTENGYLCTNILSSGNAFYIGKDKVKEIKEFITQNHKGYEIINVYESADDSETEYNSNTVSAVTSSVTTSISNIQIPDETAE